MTINGHMNGHRSRPLNVLVTGRAGFVGSHLCDALLAAGHHVICLDSFLTGARENVTPLANHPRFALVEHGICDPYEPPIRLDRIYNLACPASPPCYQADPLHTMMTCVQGVTRLLDVAERHGARFLHASTSETRRCCSNRCHRTTPSGVSPTSPWRGRC